LSEVLQFAARHEQLAGNDAEALELARDILRQSNLMNRDNPVLVTYLVAAGNDSRACDLVRVLSHDLRVLPDSNATTQPTGPASRAQVNALIAELLDETDHRRGFRTGLQTERMMEYDCAVNPVGLGVWGVQMSSIVGMVYRPIFDLDAIRVMQNTTAVADAGAASNWPAANAQLPNVDRQFSSLTTAGNATRLLSRIIMPAFDRAVLRHYRAMAERRVAALRLAIRLYQIDHGGKDPARLDELVPNYIPALPLDLFASDGRSFGYFAAPRPFVYSVGEDGADDGGDATSNPRLTPTTAPAGSPDDPQLWERRDIIFPLGRYVRPPPAPSDEN
jgi:hypothetical protein